MNLHQQWHRCHVFDLQRESNERPDVGCYSLHVPAGAPAIKDGSANTGDDHGKEEQEKYQIHTRSHSADTLVSTSPQQQIDEPNQHQ